jgi:hypothetical protein
MASSPDQDPIEYAQRRGDWTRLDWADFVFRTIMLAVFASLAFWCIVFLVHVPW